jgi:hypothetical protein
MKIALSTGVLRIPPTYFVVDHARLLATEHEFQIFALASQVCRPSPFPVHDAVPVDRLSFGLRMRTTPCNRPCRTSSRSSEAVRWSDRSGRRPRGTARSSGSGRSPATPSGTGCASRRCLRSPENCTRAGKEAARLVLLEAQATGTPVGAYDSADLRDARRRDDGPARSRGRDRGTGRRDSRHPFAR